MTKENIIRQAYEAAVERYAAVGVDAVSYTHLVHPGPCQEGCERLAGSFRCRAGTVQDGQGGYPDRSYAPRLLPDAISYATASLQIQGGSEACRYRFV